MTLVYKEGPGGEAQYEQVKYERPWPSEMIPGEGGWIPNPDYEQEKKLVEDDQPSIIEQADMDFKMEKAVDELIREAYETTKSGPIAACERMYPEMCGEFITIQKQQYEMFCKKQLDYGPGNISIGTELKNKRDIEQSLQGLWFRVNDKIQRLRTLLWANREAANEPMMDAFKDMSVYGIIAQLVFNDKWGK